MLMKKGADIMTDLLQSSEEVFFERYFEYAEDNDTTLNNFMSALDVYFCSYKECSEYAESITDGEVVDAPTVSLALQNLIFAFKYACEFKKALGNNEPIINIDSINLYSRSVDTLETKGTALVASGMSNNNFSDLEKGKYYLVNAKNA